MFPPAVRGDGVLGWLFVQYSISNGESDWRRRFGVASSPHGEKEDDEFGNSESQGALAPDKIGITVPDRR